MDGVIGALGTERQALTDLTWTLEDERHWPARMVLRSAGEVVWEEEVLRVDTVTRYVDAWFLPPDRRRSTATGARKSLVQLVLKDAQEEKQEICVLILKMAPYLNMTVRNLITWIHQLKHIHILTKQTALHLK